MTSKLRAFELSPVQQAVQNREERLHDEHDGHIDVDHVVNNKSDVKLVGESVLDLRLLARRIRRTHK